MPRGIKRPILVYLQATKPVEQQLKLMMARAAADLRSVKSVPARKKIIRDLYRNAGNVIFYGEQQAVEAAVSSMDRHHAVRQPQKVLQQNMIRNGNDRNIARLQKLLDKNLEKALAMANNKELDLANLVNPGKPGGVSYAILRIARTEMNAAFHEASKRSVSGVIGFRWVLSASHPTLDICNDYALQGLYPVAQVPDKPHPFCLCYIVPVSRHIAVG